MSEKRKSTALKTILGVLGGIFAVNLAGTAYLSVSAGKKMKSNANGNNMMYSVAFGKKKINIKPDTDHAYINLMTCVGEIELSDFPSNYDLYIELGSIFAVCAIKLPAGMRVSIEGTGKNTVVNNLYAKDIDKSLPTVHILVDDTFLSVINVVRTGSEKEYTELK